MLQDSGGAAQSNTAHHPTLMEPMAGLLPLEGMTNLRSAPQTNTPARPTSRADRRLGVGIAAVLLVDVCCHLYWATGLTWPAPDEFSLSVAVLGFGVYFRPTLLLGLALLLTAGAAVVLARGYLGRRHRFGPLWQLGAATVTAGTLLLGLLGLVWAVPAAGYVPAGFYWTNILVYTPLCLGLAVAGFRLLRPAEGRSGWRRLVAARSVAVALPIAMVVALLYGAYGLSPAVQDGDEPSQRLGALESRYVDTELARFHYVREGHGSPVVLLSPGAA